ncbi:MAG: hypothetical protein ONB42_05280 [candidate division KSB1 bacterium]|nr:hypothetical protein [candidate division KSB1 bacterium]
MDRSSRLLMVFFCFLAWHLPCFGQTTIYGGRGLMRVYSAEPIGRGQFFINTYFQTFLDPSKRRGSLGKDHTLSLGFTIGLSKRTELMLNPVLYQDDQKHVWGPPGDMRIGVKYATPVAFGGFATGIGLFVKLPFAKNHNVSYEPYSSGKLGGGIVGLVTLDLTEVFPVVPLKLYMNYGYLDHNFRDQFFTDEEDQYLVGVGLKFPIRSLVFYTEYTGEFFANNPNVSRSENSTRLSQGLKVLGPWNLIFDFAADIGLDKPVSGPFDPAYEMYKKDYADWKIIVGLNYQVQWQGSERRPSAAARLREDRRAMEELEQIRTERENAEKNLKKMQESLEEQKPPEDKPPEDEKP